MNDDNESRRDKAMPEMTAREYKEFMTNQDNIHNCENCPENKGRGKRDYDDRWPCLQYHCWIAVLTASKEG